MIVRQFATAQSAIDYIVERGMYLLQGSDYDTDAVIAAATVIEKEMQCSFMRGESPGIMSIAGVIFRNQARRKGKVLRRPP